jgi:hypothetical protein
MLLSPFEAIAPTKYNYLALQQKNKPFFHKGLFLIQSNSICFFPAAHQLPSKTEHRRN